MIAYMIRCPVCGDALDMLVSQGPPGGFGEALLGGDSRREHARTHTCPDNPNWIKGWVSDEPVTLTPYLEAIEAVFGVPAKVVVNTDLQVIAVLRAPEGKTPEEISDLRSVAHDKMMAIGKFMVCIKVIYE